MSIKKITRNTKCTHRIDIYCEEEYDIFVLNLFGLFLFFQKLLYLISRCVISI